MKTEITEHSPEKLLQRIDAIIAELQALRQTVIVMKTRPELASGDIVEELAGSLGQGNWEEYDMLLDWERFAE